MPDMTSPEVSSPPARAAGDELVDTVLAASRALVAVAARSLAAAADEVTLPQYRALVVLAARGPQGTAELAASLAVNPSTATRMCDRLVRKGLVRRHRQAGDRRSVRIALTAPGRDLVAEVTRRRRAELARLLGALPPEQHEPVIAAFRAFAAAAGEPPQPGEALGWTAPLLAQSMDGAPNTMDAPAPGFTLTDQHGQAPRSRNRPSPPSWPTRPAARPSS
jgi:DNA-binding MarR family transcriptional regulator